MYVPEVGYTMVELPQTFTLSMLAEGMPCEV
jgi:hypothetical protein